MRTLTCQILPADYQRNMDVALTSALTSNRRALKAASKALDAATYLGRPDLAWGAMALLATLEAF